MKQDEAFVYGLTMGNRLGDTGKQWARRHINRHRNLLIGLAIIAFIYILTHTIL